MAAARPLVTVQGLDGAAARRGAGTDDDRDAMLAAALDDPNPWIRAGAVLHADPGMPCVVGHRVTIGHQATVHGCTVEDECLIGIGATVLNGARIGAQSIVGAHALVPEGMQVPPGVLVVGVPAKVKRELTPEERAGLAAQAARYVANAARHASEAHTI